MTTFERIKKATQFRGSSLKKVALDSGLSENALYRYNQGVEPKYATVKLIADTLNVSVDYLLGNTDEMISNNSNVPSEKKLDKAIDRSISYDGKEITDQDRKILKAMLTSYFENKDDNSK